MHDSSSPTLAYLHGGTSSYGGTVFHPSSIASTSARNVPPTSLLAYPVLPLRYTIYHSSSIPLLFISQPVQITHELINTSHPSSQGTVVGCQRRRAEWKGGHRGLFGPYGSAMKTLKKLCVSVNCVRTLDSLVGSSPLHLSFLLLLLAAGFQGGYHTPAGRAPLGVIYLPLGCRLRRSAAERQEVSVPPFHHARAAHRGN